MRNLKVGIIADIHGNQPALQAVLERISNADALICAGDVVGYYADINEVCDLLRNTDARVIRGNHDAYVIGELQPNPQHREAYRTDWIREHLDPHHLRWLRSLPTEVCFHWGRHTLRVRHACPWDEETYLYADSIRLSEVSLPLHEILILGHTHHPMVIQSGRGLILNPGSVGQPRDWNPSACYALFDVESGKVELHRVPYDFEGLQRRLSSLHWESQSIRILSRTRQAAQLTHIQEDQDTQSVVPILNAE